MKTLIIFFTFLIGLTTKQTINEKNLTGQWVVAKAINENSKPCDMKSGRVRDFKLTFLPSNKYEQTDNYGTLMTTKGTYSVDKDNKFITLKFKTSGQLVKLNIPVVTMTNNLLVLKYNLCGATDTTDVMSGRLELKRLK